MSAALDSNTEIIYIPLLGEGVPVVRPTQGRPLGDGIFVVLAPDDYHPETEDWEFVPGSVVRCVRERHDGDQILVARDRVTCSPD